MHAVFRKHWASIAGLLVYSLLEAGIAAALSKGRAMLTRILTRGRIPDWLPIICLLTALFFLSACGSTIGQRAYAVGQTYDLLQDGANAYLDTQLKAKNPKLETVDRIADADAKASPQVQALLKCAEDLKRAEDGTLPPDAAALGLSASEVAEAKEEACESALARANKAIDDVDQALNGD
jgi:hypothetical protein